VWATLHWQLGGRRSEEQFQAAEVLRVKAAMLVVRWRGAILRNYLK